MTLKEIVRSFQIHFESGYAKMGALKVMDKRIQDGTLDPRSRFGPNEVSTMTSVGGTVPVEPETTFEIAPGPSGIPGSPRESIGDRLERMASETQSRAPPRSMNPDFDLEEKLNQILGESYFR